VIPRDYATLGAVPFSTFPSRVYWAGVFVRRRDLTGKETRATGMLVVDGSLNVTSGVLKWEGLIWLADGLTVVNGKDKSHTHIKGAVAAVSTATRLRISSQASAAPNWRRSRPTESIWHRLLVLQRAGLVDGMMFLRPVTPTRHLKLY